MGKKYIYTHCNSNRNEFYTQVNNERDPYINCFPTSMINWAKVNKINLPDPMDSSKSGGYKQPEDQFDWFMHNNEEVMSYVNNLRSSTPWIREYIDHNGGDIRELWDVEVYAFNKWVGKDVAKVNYNLSVKDILYEIQRGRAIVTSGRFCEFSHAITIVGFKAEFESVIADKNIDLIGDNLSYEVDDNRIVLKEFIHLDSYGNPNKNYKPIGVDGFDVIMDKEKFLSCINKGDSEKSVYYGIVLL